MGRFNLDEGASWKQIPCSTCERNTSASKWKCGCDTQWHRCQTHRPLGFDLPPPKRKAKEPRTLFEVKGMDSMDSTDEEELEDQQVKAADCAHKSSVLCPEVRTRRRTAEQYQGDEALDKKHQPEQEPR